jgi:hypothetical protein
MARHQPSKGVGYRIVAFLRRDVATDDDASTFYGHVQVQLANGRVVQELLLDVFCGVERWLLAHRGSSYISR